METGQVILTKMERDRCNQRRPALLPRWDLPTYKREICCDWSLRGQVSIAYLGSQVFKEGDRTLPLPLPIMVHPFLSLASALTSRFVSSSQTLDPNQSFPSLPLTQSNIILTTPPCQPPRSSFTTSSVSQSQPSREKLVLTECKPDFQPPNQPPTKLASTPSSVKSHPAA